MVEARAEQHILGPIPVPENIDFTRADLEIYEINHYRPSFTVHIYLNAPADQDLEPSHDSHAGSFSIFGHQRCSGDQDHCTVHPYTRRFDDRPSHPLTRAFKRVVITDALRRIAQSGASELTITLVVTAPPDPNGDDSREAILDYAGLQLATFDN
jgi:hypothetical protein